ncbi:MULTISPECIES: hypothetical protein [Flavobacteriaceae]|uniref:Uncharacterized protein n=1 Tax=Flagellimonas marina TaxID=1775168 RepID=A0ABV8PNP8_9FLAO
MAIFLIAVGVIFLVLVYKNVKAGLDKDWLIWTLATIGILVGVLYLSNYIDCEMNNSGYCGMIPTMIWMYAAPVTLCLMQLLYLKKDRA